MLAMASTCIQARPGASQQEIKRRAACDECRNKKLKCTGEQPACSRCAREDVACVYSPQRRMGRPKKRQRLDEDEVEDINNGTTSRGNTRAHDGTSAGAWERDAEVNIDTLDAALGPCGGYGTGVLPWLQPDSDLGWDFPLPGGRSTAVLPNENAMPGLTPDSSSGSPPLLNLPPELQNITTSHTHSHNHGLDTSTQLLLDPTLGSDQNFQQDLGFPPSLLPTCACLSTLYLTLSNLQSMDPSFTFPYSLHPLREAMSTASEVLACTQCPTKFISAIQNTQLVGTLLISIADRFGKVLSAITSEAARAEAAGENKKFRLADLNTSTSHLHAGGIGCVAAFSLDLSPAEWRSMAKKVVRAEVYGPAHGNDCCPFFLGVLDQMENRQKYYHHSGDLPEDFPKDPRTGLKMGGNNMPKEDHLCLKLVAYARKFVEAFDWT